MLTLNRLAKNGSPSALGTIDVLKMLGIKQKEIAALNQQVADKYAQLARGAIAAKQFDKARNYIDQGRAVVSTGGWRSLTANLTAAAAEEERRRQAKAKAELVRAGRVFKDTLRGGGRGPKLVVIAAGRFRMGDLNGGGDSDEKPVHAVQISKPFAMGKYEVTFADYDRYASATGKPKPEDRGWGRGSRPVINVSWEDARGYVKRLSAQTGKPYRLPSESEWEYAARASTASKYSWGDTDPVCETGRKNGAQMLSCRGSGTVSIGSFQANPFGLHDMHGNVWEWVEDCWHGSYQGTPADGSAWTRGGDCAQRVLRGGSWNNKPRNLRSANRNNNGFRVAQSGLLARVAPFTNGVCVPPGCP